MPREQGDTISAPYSTADDPSSGVFTTHVDYHSIDANLLKLDLLGKDDPTILRYLEDVTGLG